jgi:hypothetical protein
MTEENHTKRYVTNAELSEQLEKVPTRWEVRTLILGAVVASQLIPTVEIANAALSLVT